MPLRLALRRRPSKVKVVDPTNTPSTDGDVEDALQGEDPRQHFITIHRAGSGSPGQRVRVLPHPTAPGRWRIHDDDRERIREELLEHAKPSAQKPRRKADARTAK